MLWHKEVGAGGTGGGGPTELIFHGYSVDLQASFYNTNQYEHEFTSSVQSTDGGTYDWTYVFPSTSLIIITFAGENIGPLVGSSTLELQFDGSPVLSAATVDAQASDSGSFGTNDSTSYVASHVGSGFALDLVSIRTRAAGFRSVIGIYELTNYTLSTSTGDAYAGTTGSSSLTASFGSETQGDKVVAIGQTDGAQGSFTWSGRVNIVNFFTNTPEGNASFGGAMGDGSLVTNSIGYNLSSTEPSGLTLAAATYR